MSTSLEILLSPSWPSQSPHHRQHPSTSPPTRTSSQSSKQRHLYYHYQQALQSSLPTTQQHRNLPGTTAYDLEQRSIALAELLVRRRWVHPDVAGFEDLLSSSAADEDDAAADENEQEDRERRSYLTYQPLNVCVNLDEDKAVASVWLLSRIGRFSSTSRDDVVYEETVTVLHWWRRGKGKGKQKRWECFRQGGVGVVGS